MRGRREELSPMTDLEKRLRAIDQLLEQWRNRLTLFGLGGLVAQIRALLGDLVREVEALKGSNAPCEEGGVRQDALAATAMLPAASESAPRSRPDGTERAAGPERG